MYDSEEEGNGDSDGGDSDGDSDGRSLVSAAAVGAAAVGTAAPTAVRLNKGLGHELERFDYSVHARWVVGGWWEGSNY